MKLRAKSFLVFALGLISIAGLVSLNADLAKAGPYECWEVEFGCTSGGGIFSLGEDCLSGSGGTYCWYNCEGQVGGSYSGVCQAGILD